MRSGALPGAIPSPNLWRHPVEYEIENSAFDPDGTVDAALRALAPWAGARMLDVGCGTGFHLARLAAEAASVVGVEPHPRLAAAARRRTRSLPNVRVLDATAQCLPLADDTPSTWRSPAGRTSSARTANREAFRGGASGRTTNRCP